MKLHTLLFIVSFSTYIQAAEGLPAALPTLSTTLQNQFSPFLHPGLAKFQADVLTAAGGAHISPDALHREVERYGKLKTAQLQYGECGMTVGTIMTGMCLPKLGVPLIVFGAACAADATTDAISKKICPSCRAQDIRIAAMAVTGWPTIGRAKTE